MTNSWPQILQAETQPVMGGWSVMYESEDLPKGFNARGSRAAGVLELIVNHRVANDLAPDVDAVKYYLEKEWFRRDPKRFQHAPLPPAPKTPPTATLRPCETQAWFGAAIGVVNAAASTGSKQVVITALQAVQEIIKSNRFKCPGCDAWLTTFVRTHPLSGLTSRTRVQDWAWDFQSTLAAHLRLPIPPREVVSETWCWGS